MAPEIIIVCWIDTTTLNSYQPITQYFSIISRYDIVLRDGLPDWRQPIYYYRKVKKMGLAELALLLAFVATLGHYIVSWAVYLEKVFELVRI